MKRLRIKILSPVICSVLFLLFSCKKEGFLSKDQQNTLFAEPATSEIENVLSKWQSRNLTPTDYTVIQESEIEAGKYTLKIVSFKLNGIKEYGALLIPETDSLIPVRMFVGGFGLNQTVNSVSLSLNNSISNEAYILAIPALRGQSLEIDINGRSYSTPMSEGNHCDAFDGATDDVLCFLNLVQQTESYANVNRTSVRGGSRGCTVAMLAGIRDNRIKRVVAVAGPTNMIELTSQNVNDPTYQCQFLAAFKTGQVTLAETRSKMIASSPIYFARHLPLVQLHMGLTDKVVPVKQGYDMETKTREMGTIASFQLFTYNRTHTDIATNNPELTARIEQFLSQL